MTDGANISPILRRFRALAEAGYGRDLLPIMPSNLIAPGHRDYEATAPHLRLSAHSSIPADQETRLVAGKIPGKLIDDGWVGFGAWSKHEATDAGFVEWASWPGVGIGLNTRDYVAFDIDVLDAALADNIEATVVAKLGAAPVRIGRAPKRLILYRAQEPIKKRRLAFTLPDGTSHAVELLGDGEQFVAEGLHPSGNPYKWPNGDLSKTISECLPAISPDRIEGVCRDVHALILARGGTIKQSGPRDDAKPPTGEPLERERAIRMATVIDPGCEYSTWRNIVWAIMAVPLADGSAEEQHEWRCQLAHDWSAGRYWCHGCPAKYEGPEAVNAVIKSDKRGGINVGTLIDAAMKAGFDPGGEPPHAERDLNETFREAMKAQAEASHDGYPDLLSALEIAEGKFPLPVCIVEDMVLALTPGAMWGDGGAGKTLNCEHIAVAVAAGISVYGLKTRQMPVLLVLKEDEPGVTKQRLEAICAAMHVELASLPLSLFPVVTYDTTLAFIDDQGAWRPGPFLGPLKRRIGKLVEGVPDSEAGRGLVILDPMGDFAVFDANKSAPTNTFYKGVLAPLCTESRVTPFVTAHPSRAAMREGSGNGGAVAHKNSVRLMTTFERVNPDDITDPARLWKVYKGNYGAPRTVALMLTDRMLLRDNTGGTDEDTMTRVIAEEAIACDEIGTPVPKRGLHSDHMFFSNIKHRMGRSMRPKEALEWLWRAVRADLLRYRGNAAGSHGGRGDGKYAGFRAFDRIEDRPFAHMPVSEEAQHRPAGVRRNV